MQFIRRFLFFVMLCGSIQAQEIAAVFIDGNVLVYRKTEQVKAAKNLVLGPLHLDHILVLKPGARVKLMRPGGELCDLNLPGEYPVSSVVFHPKEEMSLFSKFSEYFLSFFSEVRKADEKDSHQNSIIAVSRGNGKPILLFPLEGMLNADESEIHWSWEGDCDSCTYKLRIYDFSTRKPVLSRMVKGQHYVLSNPEKILRPDKKYYWDVQGGEANLKSESNVFNVCAASLFNRQVKDIQSLLTKENIIVGSTPASLLTIASLFDQGQPNFAIQFGERLKSENTNDRLLVERISEICNRQLKKIITAGLSESE